MAKRGPKPKGEFIGKTSVFSTRIRPDTKARLVKAAANAKPKPRSLSQELEYRLRRTFAEDDKAIEFYGDTQTEAVLKIIGGMINSITSIKKPNAKWWNDRYLFERAREAINTTLDLFQPEGKPPTTDETVAAGGKAQGKVAALDLISEIQAADPASSKKREVGLAHLGNQLGELLDRPQPFSRSAEQQRRITKLWRERVPLQRKKDIADGNFKNRKGPPLTVDEERRLDQINRDLSDALSESPTNKKEKT